MTSAAKLSLECNPSQVSLVDELKSLNLIMDSSAMDGLPSNIMLDIFSRVPAKCLARSQCVSKGWCKYIIDRYLVKIHDERIVEEPIPILYHQHLSPERKVLSLCCHVFESKHTETTNNYISELKKFPSLEFLRKEPLSKSCVVRIRVRGSCNGLMCLSQGDNKVVKSLFVVHPLRRECYVPPTFGWLPFTYMSRETCGIGFDDSTKRFKLVCVLFKEFAHPDNIDLVRENLCTMVHVLGTKSWREVPQVPLYPITGEGIFVDGCLHWLVSNLDNPRKNGGRDVIWFDIRKEEFGLISPPQRMSDLWRALGSDHLVNLNGELGYVSNRTMEVWVLKQKQWVPHCRFEKHIIPIGFIDVLGCWNKDGDILIKNRRNGNYKFFVYNLKSGAIRDTNIAGRHDGYNSPNVIMYPSKLFTIHGIHPSSSLMKKTHLEKKLPRFTVFFLGIEFKVSVAFNVFV